jgi:pectate lyase
MNTSLTNIPRQNMNAFPLLQRFRQRVLGLGVLVLALAYVNPAAGAIAFDSAVSKSAVNAASVSWSHTVGSGSNTVLVVGLSTEDTSSSVLNVASIIYNGVAMTAVPNSAATAGSSTLDKSQLFYLLNPAAGAHTVAVTFGGAVNGVSAGSISLSGVAQSAPTAAATNTATSGTTISANITVSTAGSWLVDAANSGAGNATLTPGASQTKRWGIGQSSSGGAGSTESVSSAGTASVSWTASSGSQLALSVAAFAPAAGGGATAPTITTQPASQTVTVGSSVTFSVVASGTAPLSYQWKFNSANISGATSSSYTIASAQTNNAGSYTVTVTNVAGSVTSSAATLTVNSSPVAPTITTQPASQSVTAGSSVTFSVVASGTAPLRYQWKFNSANISGATNTSYTIASVQTNNAGSYTVTVTNVAGSVTSSAATLTVNSSPVAPTITTQPASQTVTAGSSVTFSVVASGTAPLSYQWKFNSANISGATSASYTISSAQTNNAGSYTVTVSNSAGSVTSSAATLTVNTAPVAPTILAQPVSQTVTAGSSVTFTVVVSGTAPISYQWKFNGANISGATSSSYTIASAQTNNAGSYTVTVSNSAGSVTSSAATLTVNSGSSGGNAQYNLTGFATVSPGCTGGGVIATTDPAYAQVTTPLQLATAIAAANKTAGSIKVIEIMNDLSLGWNEIGSAVQTLASTPFRAHATPQLHPVLLTVGMSLCDIKPKSGLTIFSANGATIKHCNFNIKSCNNIIVRNLKFDENWEWDEATKGNYDKNDWDFITIANGSGVSNVWIDHCTFTKSYDGLVDQKAGSVNVTFSWCKYVGDDGATNPNSWVRQQINALEANKSSYTFYNFLRSNGFSVEDIVQIIQAHDKTHLAGSNDKDPNNATLAMTFHHLLILGVWDRCVPRLRAGNVHNYNIYVDDSNVLVAKRLRDLRAAAMSNTSSNTLKNTYSFNPPINGSISTEGGALLVEKSVYIDCLWPLRNNQTDVTDPTYTGKILATDTIYDFLNADGTTTVVRGNSTDANNPMGPFQAPIIAFSWNLSGNKLPYTYTMDDPASLLPILQAGAGAGVLTWSKDNWLKTSY